VKEFMRKNKIKKRNVPPCTFEEYKEIYDRFWSDKTKVRKEDVGFMVKLINERKK
jgi:hypothetical protein